MGLFPLVFSPRTDGQNLQLKGLAVTPERMATVQGTLGLPSEVTTDPRSPSKAYLCLDFLPVVVGEPAAALLVQLLQDAAVDGQAVVDFCQELINVRAVGAQHTLADRCELRTGAC